MADTYELISAITVGSGGAASIDFTSIPSTYTDLCLKWSARGTNADPVEFVNISLNGSSSSFASRFLRGRGSTVDAYSDTTLVTQINGANATASVFSSGEFYFPNYTWSSSKPYSMDSVTENNATSADAVLGAGVWSNSSAINRITLTIAGARTFVQNSTAYLYGIKNS